LRQNTLSNHHSYKKLHWLSILLLLQMKSYIGHSFTAAYHMPMPCSMKTATVPYSVVGIPAQINLWVISAVSPKVAFQSTSMGFWITSRAYWLIHPWSHSAVNNASYQSVQNHMATAWVGVNTLPFHTYDLWSATAIHASEIPQTANWLYQTPLPRESGTQWNEWTSWDNDEKSTQYP